jgi:hypothetical protein
MVAFCLVTCNIPVLTFCRITQNSRHYVNNLLGSLLADSFLPREIAFCQVTIYHDAPTQPTVFLEPTVISAIVTQKSRIFR